MKHAVIRGGGACVFPIKKQTSVIILRDDKDFSVTTTSMIDVSQTFFLKKVLHYGFKLLHLPLNMIRGHFHFISDIPVGQGLGASAALSVALARWFKMKKFFKRAINFAFRKTFGRFFSWPK